MSIIKNLSCSSELVDDVVYDVCIIGAGAVGIYTANSLINDHSIAIIEAGNLNENQELESLFSTSFSKMKYRGATDGRSFGFGGTTSKWSGQLLPFLKYDRHDFDKKTKQSWRHLIDICDQYSDTVREKLLNNNNANSFENFFYDLASKNFFEKIKDKLGFNVLTSEWLSPLNRNLRWMVKKNVKKSKKSHLFLNTVASDFVNFKDNMSNIRALKVISNKETFHIKAKKFIICNGAIEGTRSLLNLYENMGYKNHSLGHYLSDHISINIGSISGKNANTIRSIFNPIFQGSNMRTFRMIEDKVDTKQKYFISFLFKYDKNPGFNLINNFINYFNGRDKIQFKDLKIFSSIIGLLKVILSKCLFGRLYVPPNENVDVLLDFEQTRLFNNSIQLSNELDSFGNKKANINWEILKKDYLKFQKIGENFVDKWNKDFIDSPINKATPENKNIKPYDVFHPVGTCMISSNENAIIDLDFKVRITENLFVINSGVIPSASIANPTFSLFCFSEYLVKKHFYNDY